MKKTLTVILLSILTAVFIFPAAGGETQDTVNPIGTWAGQDFVVNGEKAFGALTSVTFYENGTYNGILLQIIPIGGQWSMEDGIILTDDATMIFEDGNTMIIYYGEYEFICSRTDELGSSFELTPSYVADKVALLLTKVYDRIDDLFNRAIRAMEATRQYILDEKYSSLIHARILCADIMSLTEKSEVPESGFEQLDTQALSLMGIDINHLYIVTGMCAGAENDIRSISSICMDYLFGNYCYKDLSTFMYSITERIDAYFRAIARQQPLLARMIFEPLWSEPSLDSFWSSVPEKWTVIGMDFPEDTDIDTIRNLYLEMMELSEQANNEAADAINSFYTLLQEKEDHIAAGEFEFIRYDFNMPETAPSMLVPLPDSWLEPSRIRILPGGKGSGTDMPEEIFLSIQNVEEDEFTTFMNNLLPMISDSARLEKNEKDGWQCQVRDDKIAFSAEWKLETETADFWYDPSQINFVSISFNNVFLGIINSTELTE